MIVFNFQIVTIFLCFLSFSSSQNVSELRANETKAVTSLHCLMNDELPCSGSHSVGHKLLNDRQHCDIELEVKDWVLNETQIFCAHKNILSVRSNVLKDMIREMATNNNQSEKARLELYGVNPYAFQNILRYLYTYKIDPKFDTKKDIMALYGAARYLQLTDLEQSIEQYLSTSATMSDLSNYILWTDKNSQFGIKRTLADLVKKAINLDSNDWTQFRDAMCAIQDDKLVLKQRAGFQIWKELIND